VKTYNFVHLVGAAKEPAKKTGAGPTKFTCITGGDVGKNGKVIPKAYHAVVDWSHRASGVQAGDQVEVKGYITYSKWEPKDGSPARWKTEIVAQEVKFESQRSAKHLSDEQISKGAEITDEDLPF
jgi:single-stranded DNA-binding protein